MNTTRKLEVVGGSELPEPPYPKDIRASGWQFELDTTRIRQSDTWTLARPEIRPWLLMLWMVAWEQSPCGTLPADDALIGALLGIDANLFTTHRSILLRGWVKHADGRLYHPVITERVLKMISSRIADRARQKRHREALRSKEVQQNQRVTEAVGVPVEDPAEDVSRVTHALVTPESHRSHTTGTGTGTGINTLSGKPDEAEEILIYLNAKTGRRYRPVPSTLRFISGRLREGATVTDCKRVIDAKVGQWGDDATMAQYLRPETLFNPTKFASYVGSLGDEAVRRRVD